MCCRIVRIEGDGSIKLILTVPSEGCSENTLSKADSSVIGSGSYGYTTINGVKYTDYIGSTNENSSGNIFQSFALQMGTAFETRTVETATYYRPSITLKSGTSLTSRNVTISSPYIVS